MSFTISFIKSYTCLLAFSMERKTYKIKDRQKAYATLKEIVKLNNNALSEKSDCEWSDSSSSEDDNQDNNDSQIFTNNLEKERVFIPDPDYVNKYKKQMDYFSEKIYTWEHDKLKKLNEEYRPHFGVYKESKGLILEKYYTRPELKSVTSVAFSKDSLYLTRGHGDGSIKIWDIRRDRHTNIKPNNDSSKITRIKFLRPTSQFVAVSQAGYIYFSTRDDMDWDCVVVAKESGNEIEAVDFSPCTKRFVTAGSDATLRVYSYDIEGQLYTYPSASEILKNNSNRMYASEDEGHYLRVFDVKFLDGEPNVFMTGGLDGTVKIWDLRVPNSIHNILGPVINGETLDSLVNTILIGQFTGGDSLLLYDKRQLKPRTVKPTNRIQNSRGDYPYCCKFLKDYHNRYIDMSDDLIITAGFGSMEIVSVRESVVVAAFPDDGIVMSADQCFPFISYASSAHSLTVSSFTPFGRLFDSEMPFPDSCDDCVEDETTSYPRVVPPSFDTKLDSKVTTLDKDSKARRKWLDFYREYDKAGSTSKKQMLLDRYRYFWSLYRKNMLRKWCDDKELNVYRQLSAREKMKKKVEVHEKCGRNTINLLSNSNSRHFTRIRLPPWTVPKDYWKFKTDMMIPKKQLKAREKEKCFKMEDFPKGSNLVTTKWSWPDKMRSDPKAEQ